jgi:hypothetical protein
MHPPIGSSPFQVKQEAQNIKRRVTLEIEQDEEQFGLYAPQSSFPAPTSRSFARLRVALEGLLIDRTEDLAQRLKRFSIQPSQRPQQAVILQCTMDVEHTSAVLIRG